MDYLNKKTHFINPLKWINPVQHKCKIFFLITVFYFATWQSFALQNNDFDSCLEESFKTFLQIDNCDYDNSIKAVQNIYNLIEEYQQSQAFLYSEKNDFYYFNTLKKVKTVSSDFLNGAITVQQIHKELPFLITTYYRETTESYKNIWFLVFEILVIIIVMSSLLAIFTILFLRKKELLASTKQFCKHKKWNEVALHTRFMILLCKI